MDPNATLQQIREAIQEARMVPDIDMEAFADATLRAIDLFESLDEWMTKGGFIPQDWNRLGTFVPATSATGKVA